MRERSRDILSRTRVGVPLTRTRGVTLESLAAANACNTAHHEAYWDYEPPIYGGHVVLVRSDHQPRGVEPDPTLGWGPVLAGEVELFEVPSFHKTIMSGTAAATTASIFTESIEALMSNGRHEGEVSA